MLNVYIFNSRASKYKGYRLTKKYRYFHDYVWRAHLSVIGRIMRQNISKGIYRSSEYHHQQHDPDEFYRILNPTTVRSFYIHIHQDRSCFIFKYQTIHNIFE